MNLTFIEATQGPPEGRGLEATNWGKFMVARFDTEWQRQSIVYESSGYGKGPLLRTQGWSPQHILVFDLATGEGAIFLPGGSAHHDLNKHRIWVCPLFESFLAWLYKQNLNDLGKLPTHVDLKNAPFAFQGYRREGTRDQ